MTVGRQQIPQTRPTRVDIFPPVAINYALVTNILAVVVFTTLFTLSIRRAKRNSPAAKPTYV